MYEARVVTWNIAEGGTRAFMRQMTFFPSHARIIGEGSTNHSPPAPPAFFFFFLSGDQLAGISASVLVQGSV